MSTPTSITDPQTDASREAPSVLLVEEQGLARIGLEILLRKQRWIGLCLVADNRESAAALTRKHGPDVALVNVNPFLTVTVEAIRAAHPETKVVLHSRCAMTGDSLTRHVRAVGFVKHDAGARDILRVLRQAAKGASGPSDEPPAGESAVLSDRERVILTLLTTGATNREIAADLNLGTDSISKQATAIYRKLGVRNRTEAVQRVAALDAL